MTTTHDSYLGGLVVRGVEAFDGDLSEDVGLQWLLGQVTVVNDGWMQKEENHYFICSTIFKLLIIKMVC